MDSVKLNSAVAYPSIAGVPIPQESLAFGRKLTLKIPSLRISGTNIIVSQVENVDEFLPQPLMKSIEYLHTEKLERRAIKKRIWRMRGGTKGGHFENKGLMYWGHIRDQQIALKEISKIFKEFPTEVVINMERGGTFLYDTLEPHIPKDSMPTITVSTAKELSCKHHKELHIRRTVNEIYKLSEVGYKSFAIIDVAISGGQLHKIIKTLNTFFHDDMPEVHLIFLKQSLTAQTSFIQGLDLQIKKQLSKSSQLHLHLFETPFIAGEDVDPYLSYGVQNQHPINLILPDETVWQCRSSSGTRKTLIKLLSGEANALISSLYTD